MFYRQFSLLVFAILLLSPSPVRAGEIEPDSYISVGNIYIQTANDWMIIHTPKIQIVMPKSTPRSIDRDRQRRSNSVSERRRTYTPSARKKIDSDSQTTVTTNTYSSSGSIIRRSTIRSSSSNGSQSAVSEQRQSIQCSGEGNYSVSQSTSTINGRTVSSRTWTDCD